MCVRTHMARSTGCGFIFRCVALLKVQFGCICTGLGRSDCSCCAQKHLAEVILLRSSCRIILLSPLPSGLIVSVCRFLTIARHLHCNSIALRQRRHAGCPSFASHCFAVHEITRHKASCKHVNKIPWKHRNKVTSANVGQRVVLNFVNFSKARALYRCGMTPLVRSASQPQWARLPPSNCFYYKSPRHRTSNVLSVLFTIDRSVLACCACVRACVRARVRACVCVCVCAFLHDKHRCADLISSAQQ